jgi:hypothetical protein
MTKFNTEEAWKQFSQTINNDGWTITWTAIDGPYTNEVKDWLHDNLIDFAIYMTTFQELVFRNPNDAVNFKLRWCNIG